MDNVHKLIFNDMIKGWKSSTKRSLKQSDDDMVNDVSLLFLELVHHFGLNSEKDHSLMSNPNKFFDCIAGLRSIQRAKTGSFFTGTIVEMFGLQEISNSLGSIGKDIEVYSRDVRMFEDYYRRYTKSLEDAISIAKVYTEDSTKNLFYNIYVRTYASYNAFRNQEEFNKFLEACETFLIMGFVVFIEGPINVYTKLSQDGLVAIIKFMIQPINMKDTTVSDSEMIGMDLFHKAISSEYKQGFIGKSLDVLKTSLMEHCNKWRMYESMCRSIPSKSIDNFLYRYEEGELWKT